MDTGRFSSVTAPHTRTLARSSLPIVTWAACRSRDPAVPDPVVDGRVRLPLPGGGTSVPAWPKIVPLPEAVAELVRDGDTVALRGLHPPHPVRRRPRDHPAGPPRSHAGPDDPGPGLRPDDRRRAARRSSCSRGAATRASGRCTGCATRSRQAWPAPLEIEEHSHAGHGQPLRRGGVRAAVRGPARLRGHRPARAHADHLDGHLPVHRRGAGGRGRAQPRRHGRARPARRPGGQRAALGHRRRAEGGGAGRRGGRSSPSRRSSTS